MTDSKEALKQALTKARALRKQNLHEEAVEVMRAYLVADPQNVRALEGLRTEYRVMGDHERALKTNSLILGLEPTAIRHIRYGKNVLKQAGRPHEGKSYTLAHLERVHAKPFAAMVQEVRNTLPGGADRYQSRFELTDGFRAFGGLWHDSKREKYFTKIISCEGVDRREAKFYSRLQSYSAAIRQVTPRHVSSINRDDIAYLTMEQVTKGKVSPHVMRAIQRVPLTISGSMRHDVIAKMKRKPFKKLELYPVSALTMLSESHTAAGNNKLLKALKVITAKSQFPALSRQLAGSLHDVVGAVPLHELIAPRRDFGFVHGDFHAGNIFATNRKQIKLIDWSNYTIGPRLIDNAYYFTFSSANYSEIMAYIDYLSRRHRLTKTDILLFHYSLIIFTLLQARGENTRLLWDVTLPAHCAFLRLLEEALVPEGISITKFV